jgi:hypothetical protein
MNNTRREATKFSFYSAFKAIWRSIRTLFTLSDLDEAVRLPALYELGQVSGLKPVFTEVRIQDRSSTAYRRVGDGSTHPCGWWELPLS